MFKLLRFQDVWDIKNWDVNLIKMSGSQDDQDVKMSRWLICLIFLRLLRFSVCQDIKIFKISKSSSCS